MIILCTTVHSMRSPSKRAGESGSSSRCCVCVHLSVQFHYQQIQVNALRNAMKHTHCHGHDADEDKEQPGHTSEPRAVPQAVARHENCPGGKTRFVQLEQAYVTLHL
jgi:hypothetical protein